jgi:hypothetical protein
MREWLRVFKRIIYDFTILCSMPAILKEEWWSAEKFSKKINY